ncbi:MAG TPA: hypothetical protein VK749_02790 [Xanthobacteraceae bacterium]|nr:hypothetical protein [Xanthobacteraceae bacterium]
MREIQRALGGIAVFAARRKSAFRAVESALSDAPCRVSRRSGWCRMRYSKSVRRGPDEIARGRREFSALLLIVRDFSGLTLTSGKSRTLNSSVNRAFGTFVDFFTSN